MPSCIFCGAHVIPASVKDSLPAVCAGCNLHLDALIEDRINKALKNYEMPKDAIQQAIADNIGEFIQKWEIDFKQRMDALVKDGLQDLKISGCSPDILALEDKITEMVQKTLREGIANMKPKPLSRGRKKAA